MAQSARTPIPASGAASITVPGDGHYTNLVLVKNTGTVALEVGGTGFAAGDGYPLAVGDALSPTDMTKGLTARNVDATTAGEVAVLVVE